MVIIETDSLVKQYGKVHALKGVTLKIYEGAIELLGPNDASKTTLLRILLGLTTPTSGTSSIKE